MDVPTNRLENCRFCNPHFEICNRNHHDKQWKLCEHEFWYIFDNHKLSDLITNLIIFNGPFRLKKINELWPDTKIILIVREKYINDQFYGRHFYLSLYQGKFVSQNKSEYQSKISSVSEQWKNCWNYDFFFIKFN